MDGIYILASTTKSDFSKFIDTTSSNAGKDRWRFPVEIHTLTHVQPNFLALGEWPVRVHAYCGSMQRPNQCGGGLFIHDSSIYVRMQIFVRVAKVEAFGLWQLTPGLHLFDSLHNLDSWLTMPW